MVGGALSKNNAKMGRGVGLKLKILLLQGGANFHFMSCAFALNCLYNSTCIVEQEMYSQCSMFLENVKFIFKKISSHFRHDTRFFTRCKRIDLCHKISIILVSIIRPNSTENIPSSNIYDCPKQLAFVLRYCFQLGNTKYVLLKVLS